MGFEVYRKRGRHWQFIGRYIAEDSLKAARHASYVHNLKVVGVRPEGSLVKVFAYHFRFVHNLTSA